MIINKLNPIAIEVFGLQIMWYAIFIMLGIFLAVFLGLREADRLGMKREVIIDGVLYCVPLCILGARLYYILFSWGDGWSLTEIIGFENGEFVGLRGLAINGGIITAAIFVVLYCKKTKLNLLSTLDLVAPGFLIGQLCGRWGNFFNQEAYGKATSYEFLSSFLPEFIVEQMNIGGTYYQPTFLYESLWNTLGFVLILFIRRTKWVKIGDLFPMYLIWYGFFRGVVIEPLRLDPLYLGGIKINIVMNICLAILGGVLLYLKRNPKIQEKFHIENKYYHEKLEENNDGQYSFI